MSACQSSGYTSAQGAQVPSQTATPFKNLGQDSHLTTPAPSVTVQPSVTPSSGPQIVATAASTERRVPSPTSSATPSLVNSHPLPAEEWKSWPVIPVVPQTAREIYQRGLRLGTDPHAFSILGDCQSLPETFLGVYDTDPVTIAALPVDLQAVVVNFAGSFGRMSPTVKGGTTAGAVLWSAWHENQYTCTEMETPLECELRLHNPSIVIINLGTHYETRNIIYLRKILDQLTGKGVLPILSTKADNRELDERLNLEMAQLAIEYNIPLWNFWAATLDLPNHGVGIKEGEEHLGEIYLSEAGLERHRLTALQALSAVWQAVK